MESTISEHSDYGESSWILKLISKNLYSSVEKYLNEYNNPIYDNKGYNIFVKLKDIDQINFTDDITKLKKMFIDNAINKVKFNSSIKIEKIKKIFHPDVFNTDKEKINMDKNKNFNNKHGAYNTILNIISIRDTMKIESYFDNLITVLYEIPEPSTIKKPLINCIVSAMMDNIQSLDEDHELHVKPNFSIINNHLNENCYTRTKTL